MIPTPSGYIRATAVTELEKPNATSAFPPVTARSRYRTVDLTTTRVAAAPPPSFPRLPGTQQANCVESIRDTVFRLARHADPAWVFGGATAGDALAVAALCHMQVAPTAKADAPTGDRIDRDVSFAVALMEMIGAEEDSVGVRPLTNNPEKPDNPLTALSVELLAVSNCVGPYRAGIVETREAAAMSDNVLALRAAAAWSTDAAALMPQTQRMRVRVLKHIAEVAGLACLGTGNNLRWPLTHAAVRDRNLPVLYFLAARIATHARLANPAQLPGILLGTSVANVHFMSVMKAANVEGTPAELATAWLWWHDARGDTVQHLAAAAGDVLVLEHLYAFGASFAVYDGSGETPIHRAIRGNRVNAVQYMASVRPAAVEVPSRAGDSPLDLTMLLYRTHPDIFQTLRAPLLAAGGMSTVSTC
jgi:hypothetical protein